MNTEKKLPEWAKILFAIVLPGMATAVAYGKLLADQEALASRVSKSESQAEDVRKTLTDIQIDIAKICTKLQANCGGR